MQGSVKSRTVVQTRAGMQSTWQAVKEYETWGMVPSHSVHVVCCLVGVVYAGS
jgi:hypothetical protein